MGKPPCWTCTNKQNKTAMSSGKFDVKYRGFVYIEQPGSGLPDRQSIEKAAKMLKSHKKMAQDIHPLFARGLDTKLHLEVKERERECVCVCVCVCVCLPVCVREFVHVCVCLKEAGKLTGC